MYSPKCSKLSCAKIPVITCINVNGVTFKGSNSSIFASLLSMGQLLKERICSFRSKFFPFKVDPSSKKVPHLEKQTGISAN